MAAAVKPKIVTPPASERIVAAVATSFETEGGSLLSNIIRGWEASDNPEYQSLLHEVESVLKEQSNAYHLAMLRKRINK